MTLTLGKKKCRKGFNVCMNYEFNLLHHVDVVAKRVRAAAAHEGDDSTPSSPTGRGVKSSNCVTELYPQFLIYPFMNILLIKE